MAKQNQKKNGNGCPITRERFLKNAKSLTITIEGRTLSIPVKEFSTGSFGWWTNDKFNVTVDGVELRISPNISLVVVHSADAK